MHNVTSDNRSYKRDESMLLSGWQFLSFIVLSRVTTPLSLVEFPLSGDLPSFEIGMAADFITLSFDRSIATK